MSRRTVTPSRKTSGRRGTGRRAMPGWHDDRSRATASICLLALFFLLVSPLATRSRSACGACDGSCCKAPGPAHRGCALFPGCCGGARGDADVAPASFEGVPEDRPAPHLLALTDDVVPLPSVPCSGLFASAPPDPPPRDAL